MHKHPLALQRHARRQRLPGGQPRSRHRGGVLQAEAGRYRRQGGLISRHQLCIRAIGFTPLQGLAGAGKHTVTGLELLGMDG